MHHPSTVDDALVFAQDRALRWKGLFDELYDIVYDHCADNRDVYIYSITKTLAYLRSEAWKPTRVDMDFVFVLLSKTPVQTARRLATVIIEKYSPYVSISASIAGLEQVISVDNVRLISISLFMENTDSDVISPWYDIGSSAIQLLEPIMTLFYLSRELYHPTHLVDIMNGGESGLLRDFSDITTLAYNKVRQCGVDGCIDVADIRVVQKRDNVLTQCIDSIVELASGDLLGKMVLAGYANNGAMQVCAYRSIDVAKAITKTVRDIRGVDKSSYIMSTGFVMGDFRLKRVSVHVISHGRRVHVASVFNNLSYEAIPLISMQSSSSVDNMKLPLVAHPFVELRMWLYGVAFQRFYGKQKDELGGASLWAHVKSTLDRSKGITSSVFYVGKYRDERVDKIKMGMSVWRPPYDMFMEHTSGSIAE